MGVTPELAVLHRAVEELRSVVGSVLNRYGDIPAVRRLLGDVDRLDLDAAELDDIPVSAQPEQQEETVLVLDDKPHDPSLWADADDEGLGGYQRGANR
jgi:hypothetical protein